MVSECAKHVCRHPKVVENDHRSRNQQRVEAGQSEKGRGIQITVAVNDEAGSGREPFQKAGQGVLKPPLDEANPLVVDLRDRTPRRMYPWCRFRASQPLRYAGLGARPPPDPGDIVSGGDGDICI
jgi:hypothetical protein